MYNEIIMKYEALGLDKEDISILHDRALETVDRARVSEADFIEPYGEETVRRDLEKVRSLEESFSSRESGQEMKKIADIFEALIIEHGELSNWFGENAVTIKTSKFDDYENGVDAVIEFRGDEPRSASYLGLAADVTFTNDTTKKFDRLKAQIRSGELARVKYFHSEHMNIHGQLSKLPEVVIGASKATVLELAELWMAKQNRALAEHRIQMMILHQIEEQLLTFAMYAESLGRSEAVAIYNDRYDVVQNIIKEKADIESKVGNDVLHDPVHAEIMNFLARWRQSIASGSGTA